MLYSLFSNRFYFIFSFCRVAVRAVSLVRPVPLPNLFIGTLIECVRSFITMLPSVKFAEDKVLVFFIFSVKNAKIVQR